MTEPRSTPLQNRVDPFGNIVATPERGLFMGNRGGCFHDDHQRLTSVRWTSRRWITCDPNFKGRKMPLMAPGRYTQLFFLDEATALAAGHRPCFECRRGDAVRFFEALAAGIPGLVPDGTRLPVDVVDRRLHTERVFASTKAKRTVSGSTSGLPGGAMVTLASDPAQPFLLRGGQLFPWSFGGYGSPVASAGEDAVTVLTPPSTLAALRAGYEPAIHPSARA